MGLSVLAFVAAAGILLTLVVVALKGRTAASRFEIAINLCLAAFAVVEGLASFPGAQADADSVVRVFRLIMAFLFTAEILMLNLALCFPRRLGGWSRIVSAASVVAAAACLYLVIGTSLCIGGATNQGGRFYPVPGPAFNLLRLAALGFAIAAVVIHAVRMFQTDDSINRQRSALVLAAVLVGTVSIFLFMGNRPGMRTDPLYFSFPAILALGMAVTTSYSLSISRLFDWREFFRTLASYILIAVVIGIPAGGVILLLLLLGSRSQPLVLASSALTFFVAFQFARNFSTRFLERVGSRNEYREMLESALAHIDLSAGRDAVLADLDSVLTENLGCQDITILIEDDRGVLRTAHATSGGHAILDRNDAVRERLERSGASIVMLSEAQADSAYAAIQEGLLALFAGLKAEVLIIAREGRRIIGVFGIGQRKNGSEYTAYDYDTFKAMAGKLFVFAFYLKNVARESIVYTVDRELALSDQVIRFALEHVAPVDSPHADAAWAMRSTRSLGGDFVDFVRIGKERWFFVLGDVSGKGLSASMNMLILKSMIRTFLRIERDFAGLVQRVNAFIKDYLPKGSFFAGVFGYFDFEKRTLYFINCGVPAILLYSPAFDAFIEVQGEGKVLGFVRDVKPLLKPRKLTLSPGTALVLSTDGLLDSENIRGERFGKDRLRKAARTRLDLSAREIADGTIEDLMEFTGKHQEDDITLLAMKIK